MRTGISTPAAGGLMTPPRQTTDPGQATETYESDALLAQYCEFHYGPPYLGVDNFPRQCARLCLAAMAEGPRARALDLGCATGRASFELARDFARVDGVDASRRFIHMARQLQEMGQYDYALPSEGDLREPRRIRLQDLGLADVAHKVLFRQEDACALAPEFSAYDLIFAGNLIDRMACPRSFLGRVHQQLRKGGLLILTSPYTWQTAFTPKQEWLGGFLHQGQAVTSLQGLHAVLTPRFRPLGSPRQIPFVIRETARKFQHSQAEMTIWEKT